jgi:hypothetical protein
LRQSRALVTIVDAPPGVKEAAAVQTTAQAMFSRPQQLLNGISHTTGKIAGFEPDFWRLDGSFMLPVAPTQSQLEVGFVSAQMSDFHGNFAMPPEIVIRFAAAQNLPQICLMFDRATGEAAESARLRAFNAAGAMIMDETITGNGGPFMSSRHGAQGAARVVITILSTANPLRRARVAEVHFGRVMHYDGEDIAHINSVHQTDPHCNAFPQNRLRLKIFNKGRFGILGDTGDARHLQERQTVEYTQGIIDDTGTRWSHIGNFALDGWQIKENFVELTALGRSCGLGDSVYHDSTFQMYTLGQMARHVAAAAGFEVHLPRAMDQSPFMPRFFGNVTHRAALMMIARLASCLLFEDSAGVLRFVDIVDEAGNTADRLDYEGMFAPPEVALGTFYNGILLTETLMSVEPGRVSHTDVEISGSTNVMIPFDRPIFSGGHAAVAPGFSLIGSPRFHAMFMTATIAGHGRCAVEIHGNRADFAHSQHFYPAPWYTGGPRHPYVVNLPMFFQNMTHLRQVRDWFLRRKFAMLAKRVAATAHWRQNPALGPGDRVHIQVDRAGRMLPAHVVHQELDFDRGVLRGKTKAVARP